MRHAVFCAVLALVAVMLQVMLIDRVPLPRGSAPDVVLVLVVAVGLTQGQTTGMLTGFFAGLDLDLAPPASHLVGESALIFCLVGYGCGQLADWLDRSAPRLLATALVGTGIGEMLEAAAGMTASDPGVTLPAVGHVLPAALLDDVLVCPVVLSLVVLASRRPRLRQPSASPVPLRWSARVLDDRRARAGNARRVLLRRQVRVCRQVPRWSRGRYAAHGRRAGASGGIR